MFDIRRKLIRGDTGHNNKKVLTGSGYRKSFRV